MLKNKVCFFQRGSIEIVTGEGTHEFPYHSHESYLIGVVKSGVARFVIGDSMYLLEGGMTYLVPSGMGISITPITPYSYLTICIKNEMNLKFTIKKSNEFVVQKLGDKIQCLCQRFKSDKLSDEEFVNELAEVLKLYTCDKVVDKQSISTDVQKAVDYIKDHCNDKFVLDELVQAVHLSKYHLIRAFKREMSVTPKQFDQQCKIRQAKKCILHREAEVDIALDLNFSNQSHLCTMFKRYMGISMKDYKKNFIQEKQ